MWGGEEEEEMGRGEATLEGAEGHRGPSCLQGSGEEGAGLQETGRSLRSCCKRRASREGEGLMGNRRVVGAEEGTHLRGP